MVEDCTKCNDLGRVDVVGGNGFTTILCIDCNARGKVSGILNRWK